MNIPETVERIQLCDPIKSLLFELGKRKGIITKQSLADYHFSELYFEVSNVEMPDSIVTPQGITNPSPETYTCTCHWSTVKLLS
jgi:hypothetical protein